MKIFWICGHHTVSEAIKNPKRKVVQVICKENSPIEKLCNAHNVKYQYYKHNDENKIIKNKDNIAHQHTFAQIESLPNQSLKNISSSDKINFIALENITDVRNIGSIIRTAVCFGVQGLIIEKKNRPDFAKRDDYSSVPRSRIRSVDALFEMSIRWTFRTSFIPRFYGSTISCLSFHLEKSRLQTAHNLAF